MKKTAICAAVSLSILSATVAYAGYSQAQIENSINNALSWQEEYASPGSTPGSMASDYFIIAMARMNKSYDFDSYARVAAAIDPSTKQDAQRIIMANTSCGHRFTASYVGMFTYEAELDTASDITDALITLDSGGYNIVDSDIDKNSMVSTLMTMQQSNGSFENNILSTAKAVIALSNYVNTVYELSASNGGTYSYNTNSSIDAALDYLSSNQQADGGFGSIMNTAYTIMALNSMGIDADNDERFQKDGNSGVGYIISMQNDNGSFQNSAEDTAIASCSLVSQLRSMQGKAKFFSFKSRDTLNSTSSGASSEETPSGGSSSSNSGASNTTSSNATPAPTPTQTQKVIQVTPMPTISPEHSAISAEQYGPFPFVGPVQQTDEESDNDTVSSFVEDTDDSDDDGMTGRTKGIIIVAAVILLMCGSVFYLYRSQPEAFKALLKKAPAPLKKNKLSDVSSESESTLDSIDFDEYKFVETEEVNSYLENFDQIKSSDTDDDDDDEYVEIPKF